jgi:NACHT domain- and WD repeat-containing protein
VSAPFFRIFVSSTFADFKAERAALHRDVFPYLESMCHERGARLEVIDLQWGISQEAQRTQRTVDICLEEVRRCRSIGPPNCLALLGDRYGWRPVPHRIPEEEFRIIRGAVDADACARLDGWYLPDDNADPLEYVLRARGSDSAWASIEQTLRDDLVRGASSLSEDCRRRYGASATELEVVAGALTDGAGAGVVCLLRSIAGLPDGNAAAAYADLGTDGRRDRAAHAAVERLKDELRGLSGARVHEYEARWLGDRPTEDHVPGLCADARSSLQRAIDEQVRCHVRVSRLEAENADHQRFATARTRHFVGRRDARARIAAFFSAAEAGPPLVILGSAGSGKSSLVAKAVFQASRRHPGAAVIVRFVGVTPTASIGRTLLADLASELSGRGEMPQAIGTYEQLADVVRDLLEASGETPTLVAVDGLDQLAPDDPARDLAWLPDILPGSVRLVLSATSDDLGSDLCEIAGTDRVLELDPLSRDEAAQFVEAWLSERGRRIQPRQLDAILDGFRVDATPLYLRLAVEQAQRWGADQAAPLRNSSDEIIDDFLESLEAGDGAALVGAALGYLAAARHGLAENELMAALSTEARVMPEVRSRTPEAPDMDTLPAVVWSRLRYDLDGYLSERGGDVPGLIGFFHRQVRDGVARRYLVSSHAQRRHRELAQLFADGGVAPRRRLSELPYHQTHGELWDPLFETLTDVDFLERKVAEFAEPGPGPARGVQLLEDDLARALERWPT